MKKLLELLTCDDNNTFEPAYFWSACIIVVGLGLSIYGVVTGKPFDLQSYGMGSAAMLAGLGAAAKWGK